MGDVVKAFPESLDEVLSAVRETPRGRWFLEQYESRLRSGETTRILDAISRLETHLQSLGNGSEDSQLLSKAREAIAAARRDIAASEPALADQSREARLFALLAEKARAAFSSPETGRGVARALQLVSDLDRELAGKAANSNAATPTDSRFFAQDAAVFETAPVTAPAPAPKPFTSAVPAPEPVSRGAKLIIRRANEPEAPTPAAEMPVEAQPAPAPLEREEPPVLEITKPPMETPAPISESRITIIRRSADEMQDLPLIDGDLAGEQSASAA
jgi:hypothetical protein